MLPVYSSELPAYQKTHCKKNEKVYMEAILSK